MATRGESPGGEAGRTGIRGPTRDGAAETSVTTGLRALIIVSRDRPDLARNLGRQSVGVNTVILDRRRAEQRRVDGRPGLEGRPGDRRQPLVQEEREVCRQAGDCVGVEYARA